MITSSRIRRPFARPFPGTFRKAPRRGRPALEVLEDRCVPSTFGVTNNLDDSNAGSLRWAVAQVNADPNPDADTIQFAATLTGGQTIALGSTLTINAAVAKLTLSAAGSARVTLSGGGLVRDINTQRELALENLTIADGAATDGAGIFATAPVTAIDCTFSANHASNTGSSLGGAIDSSAGVTVTNCAFDGNSASASSNTTGYPYAYGGAIYSGGNVTATDCTFEGNSASASASASAGVVNEPGRYQRYEYSYGYAYGGAIYSAADVSATDSTFDGNCASASGDAPDFPYNIYARDSASAQAYAYGGAIDSSGATTVTNCTFDGDYASGTANTHSTDFGFAQGYAYGGAIESGGAVTAAGCTFLASYANGSGFASGNARGYAYGGAVDSGGEVTVADCTFATNYAKGYGEAILYNAGNAYGGAICSAGDVTATGCDFPANYALGSSPILYSAANYADGDAYGGAIDGGGDVTATGCTFPADYALASADFFTFFREAHDQANAYGGAIYSHAQVTVTDCTFSADHAAAGPFGPAAGGAIFGAGVTATNCAFNANYFSGYYFDGSGGAIGSSAQVTVTNCMFSANHGYDSGGAISGAADVTATDCTFSANYASSGGAIFGAGVTVTNCAFSVNYASVNVQGQLSAGANAQGGAILGYGQVMATNCTFDGNYANGHAEASGYYFDGSASSSAYGGAIAGAGVTATDCEFSANYAKGYASGYRTAQASASGGAISSGADLAVTDCTFSANYAWAEGTTSGASNTGLEYLFSGVAGATGGALTGAGVTATDCTFLANYAHSYGYSPHYGNGTASGGALTGAGVTATNCTFSTNSTDASCSALETAWSSAAGGAIAGNSGTVVNCIFASGSASASAPRMTPPAVQNFSATAQGGGVSFSSVTLDSCLFFNNSASVNPDYDPARAVASNIRTGDPVLGPLHDNGGTTPTMALGTGSAALDTGTPGGVPTDQRGFIRDTTPDIGAFELQHPENPAPQTPGPVGAKLQRNYVVNTTSDSLRPGAGLMSLTRAIALANADGVASIITFDSKDFATPRTITRTDPIHLVPSSVGTSFYYQVVAVTLYGEVASPEAGAAVKTATLTWNAVPGAISYKIYRRDSFSGHGLVGTVDRRTWTFTDPGSTPSLDTPPFRAWLELSDTTSQDTIAGPAAGVTIDGGGLGPILQIDTGAAASFSGLTISGGNSNGVVGNVTVYKNAALTMDNCTVSNNTATGTGGNAGFRTFGTAVLTNCTISDNIADTAGGGIAAQMGSTVTLINCTVSGNTGGVGGGIVSQAGSSVTLTNCTVSANTGTSATATGGVLANGGTVRLTNTIVAGNTGNKPDVSGNFRSQGHNLIGKADGSSGWVGSDLTGTIAAPLDPLLGPLGNYGGPTQTMALLPGSPAIDAGTATGAPSTDQRGMGRLGNVDIGAFEVNVQPQTISFGPLAGVTYGDADLAIGATATSGLPVSFTASGNASVQQIAGVWYVHITRAGSATITAHQAGNTGFAPAPDVARDLTIAKADAVIVVSPYTGATTTYDGKAHTATGTATGVGGANLSGGLNLSGTTHTDAGTYNGDAWSFAGNTNYKPASGTVNNSIAKADATVNVAGFTGTYDTHPHGASGTAKGLGGVDLSSGLNLGASFTYPPGGMAHWAFSGGTNYKDQSGDVAILIQSTLALAPIATPDTYIRSFTYTFQAVATGGAGTLTYSLTGTPDASIDPQTGAIIVTPTVPGTLTFRVQVVDEQAGIATRDVSIVVKALDVVGGILFVGGNGSDNKIQLLNHGPTQPVLIYVDNVRIDQNNIVAKTITSIQVSGGAGNDTIWVEPNLGQPETIWGGAGNDAITAGGGLVTIYGGAGNDVIGAGSSAGALILGGADNDSIGGSLQSDLIFGEADNDTVQGNNGDDAIVGGEGADLLGGGAGRDLVIGGDGADVLVGNGGEDILVAGSTDYDAPTAANMGALTAIRRFWSGVDPSAADFLKRVSGLSTGSNGYAGPQLNASTVHDDNAIDALYGDNAGTNADIDFDWYILNNQGGGAKDLIKDLTDADELLALLDL